MLYFNKIIENQGFGFALDLGFVYTKKTDARISNAKRPCMSSKNDYKWKLGISLTDIGAITFRKNAAEHHFLTEDGDFNIESLDTVACLQDVIDSLSNVSYGNTSESHLSDKFRMGLPTSLNLQLDYKLIEKFYVKLLWVQPFRLFKYSVTKVPKLAVAPRYESDLIDFGVPVTLYNYSHINVGAFLRVACLTVGTENLGAFLGFGKSHGAELYVSLKFYLTKGHCLGPKRDACWSEGISSRNKAKRR